MATSDRSVIIVLQAHQQYKNVYQKVIFVLNYLLSFLSLAWTLLFYLKAFFRHHGQFLPTWVCLIRSQVLCVLEKLKYSLSPEVSNHSFPYFHCLLLFFPHIVFLSLKHTHTQTSIGPVVCEPDTKVSGLVIYIQLCMGQRRCASFLQCSRALLMCDTRKPCPDTSWWK